MKFGDLRVTAIASQQKTKRGQIEIKGGAQYQEFDVRADEYDENRHFLLSHYNRDQFEGALTNRPTSPRCSRSTASRSGSPTTATRPRACAT